MIRLIVFSGFSLFSSASHAHVKWFVSDTLVENSKVSPAFGMIDSQVYIWAVIALLLILISVFLDPRLPEFPSTVNKVKHLTFSLLRVFTGLSLLITAYTGSLIAPHYEVSAGYWEFFLYLEFCLGLMLILGVFVWQASLLLIVLALGVLFIFGLLAILEYINVVGIALFLLFMNFPILKLKLQLQPYAISTLRILTGVALITLGLSEKVLVPELGEQFVSIYHWNFMKNLGFEYSDQLFVFSAGVMEIVFGIILVIGSTTRLNVIAISLFMLTSNVTFFIQGNIEEAIIELIGHMPIIATAIICIFYGAGQRFLYSESLLGKLRTAKLTH